MTMSLITFDAILRDRGVSRRESRLLRHHDRAANEWRRGKEAFGHFASYQKEITRSPYKGCRYAFHFIPDQPVDNDGHTALFVGATEVLDEWKHDGRRRARMSTPEALQTTRDQHGPNDLAYDLEWMVRFEDLVERLVIAWNNPRTWSQWADRNPKEVVELRRCAQEPSFPGFRALITSFEDIPLLWRSWRTALASVRGVCGNRAAGRREPHFPRASEKR